MFGKTFKDPSNTNEKFLRTNIRNLKSILEEKGLDPQKIANSIKNITLTKFNDRNFKEEFTNKAKTLF